MNPQTNICHLDEETWEHRKKQRHRGYYMSDHALLNESVKSDKMRGLPSILSLFRTEFNKLINTEA